MENAEFCIGCGEKFVLKRANQRRCSKGCGRRRKAPAAPAGLGNTVPVDTILRVSLALSELGWGVGRCVGGPAPWDLLALAHPLFLRLYVRPGIWHKGKLGFIQPEVPGDHIAVITNTGLSWVPPLPQVPAAGAQLGP